MDPIQPCTAGKKQLVQARGLFGDIGTPSFTNLLGLWNQPDDSWRLGIGGPPHFCVGENIQKNFVSASYHVMNFDEDKARNLVYGLLLQTEDENFI